MAFLRQYVLSIVAASLISGIVMGFFQGGTVKQLLKMICGAFLAFMVIRPIQQFDLEDLAIQAGTEIGEGTSIAAMGTELTREAIADIIKSETEAYILDKAAQMNVSVKVQVTVSDGDPPVPVSVVLSGTVPPYTKQRLSEVLSRELGIAKEDQRWTG